MRQIFFGEITENVIDDVNNNFVPRLCSSNTGECSLLTKVTIFLKKILKDYKLCWLSVKPEMESWRIK